MSDDEMRERIALAVFRVADPLRRWEDFGEHVREHWLAYADVVLPLIREAQAKAKAEVLRQEADEFGSGYWPATILKEDVQLRLRARAEEIEGPYRASPIRGAAS